MNTKVERFLHQLIPFLVGGIAIALMIALLILFSYVIVWGILIGAILWMAAVIKKALFSNAKREIAPKGRIIEHRDKD